MTWEQFQYDYLRFDGRINRWPYFWKPILFSFAVSCVLMILEMILPVGIMALLFKVVPFVLGFRQRHRRLEQIWQ